ncbi:PD-(D/E)XK motif protein [Candidatus Tokpelaia sp.]|uniref:PD-(D/E)XK motif protein n=1 Tax=Candidatus Tokpelaia sp. TaxID=2233777 RepID=UPI001680910C|nr:PD-(D/E)XK motif protein [Candidatus Tokpelaia sp.]
MTNNRFPWNDIAVPQTGLKLIQVNDTHHHDFSWGKDSNGKALLALALPGLDEKGLRQRKIELSGIKTDIRRLPDSGHMYFQLTLLTSESADIFHALCNDIIEKTRTVPDLSAALNLVYQRLERWRAFLSKVSRGVLTRQEFQSLFTELSFLEECIDKGHVSAQTAAERWQGPPGAPHDFIFGSKAVEIKSVDVSFADGVCISTEGQLTTHLNALYLYVIFLMQDIQGGSVISLNSLVDRIRSRLAGEVLAIPDGRLFDIPDYGLPCFGVSQVKTCEVAESFLFH